MPMNSLHRLHRTGYQVLLTYFIHPFGIDKLVPTLAGGYKSLVRLQGAWIHHGTYAAYRRIWLVHSLQG